MRGSTERFFVAFAWLILVATPCFAQDAIAPPPKPPQPPQSEFATPPAALRLDFKSDRAACAPADPVTRLAWTMCASADTSQAIKGCTEIIDGGDADKSCLAEAYFRRGTVHAQSGRYDLAISDLSDAVGIDWYYIEAYVNRGIALDAAGGPSAAERDYVDALAMTPSGELSIHAQKKADERRAKPAPRTASAEDFVVAPEHKGTWQSDRTFGEDHTFKATAQNTKLYEVVKVFYATNRRRTESERPDEAFAGDRGELTFGMCEVSIPFSHTTGGLEDLGFMQTADPSRHIMLQKVSSLSHDDFITALKQRMTGTSGRKALLYIHGFNVSFRDAARRTAQLQKDLEFDGAAAFYSWPSQASALSYVVNSTNAEWSISDLRRFLSDFAATSGADKLFIIAHSMGTYLLTNALTQALNEDPALGRKIAVLVLAAPDIDAAVFKRDLAPRLVAGGSNVVLYSSNSDNALWASGKLHGYVRAGNSSGGALVVDGIDTIDAGGIDTSQLGHSYYGGAKAVLSDISDLIKSGHRAAQRSGLSAHGTGAGGYWQILSSSSASAP